MTSRNQNVVERKIRKPNDLPLRSPFVGEVGLVNELQNAVSFSECAIRVKHTRAEKIFGLTKREFVDSKIPVAKALLAVWEKIDYYRRSADFLEPTGSLAYHYFALLTCRPLVVPKSIGSVESKSAHAIAVP